MTTNDLSSQLLDQIATWSRTFRLDVGDEALQNALTDSETDPLGMLLDPVDLARTSSEVARRYVQAHADARGMPYGREAASLAFQRYSHRVFGVPVAIWVARRGVLLELPTDRLRVLVLNGSAERLVTPAVSAREGATAQDLIAQIIDGHLLPVAESMHEVTGTSMANLWGNMAASIAAACRQLSKVLPAPDVLICGEELLSTREQLVRGGEFRLMNGPQGERVHFDRSSCCHWYAASGGKYCSWCSKLTREERTERFERLMGTSDTH